MFAYMISFNPLKTPILHFTDEELGLGKIYPEFFLPLQKLHFLSYYIVVENNLQLLNSFIRGQSQIGWTEIK